MKVTEILREYNEQRLIHDFGKKLIEKYKEDTFRPEVSADKIILMINNLDPTPNKELTFWLVNNYANNRINRWEDISSRAVPALLKFKALLRKPNLNPPLQIRDINQIKGLSQLENIVEKYPDEESESQKEQNKKLEQEFYKSGQAELLYNSDILKVIIPKSEAASCYFGKGTRWCTAAKNNNMFSEYYKKDDPLYIVYIKGTNEKYQFHFGSEQFMNSKDEEVDPIFLFKRFPELLDVFCPNTKGNFWERLYQSKIKEIKNFLSTDDRTPDYILEDLSYVDEYKENIALNLNTSSSTLDRMAEEIIEYIRNNEIYPDGIQILSSLVRNTNISSEILEKVINLKDTQRVYTTETYGRYILIKALSNHKMPVEILHKLSHVGITKDSDYFILMGIIYNIKTPIQDLVYIRDNTYSNRTITVEANRIIEKRAGF